MTTTRKGMTLVELTAALMIGALMTVAVLSVVAHLPRADAAARASAERSAVEVPLRALLSEDLLQARQQRKSTDGFELKAHSSLDPVSLEARHFDAIIGYTVQPAGGRNYLVRTQRSDLGGVSSELVAAGVSAIALELPPAPATTQPVTATPDGWQYLPAAATVVVGFDAPDHPPLRVSVMMR